MSCEFCLLFSCVLFLFGGGGRRDDRASGFGGLSSGLGICSSRVWGLGFWVLGGWGGGGGGGGRVKSVLMGEGSEERMETPTLHSAS